MTRLALVTTEDNVGCEYYEIIVLIVFVGTFGRVVCTDSLVRCLLRYILGSKFCVIFFLEMDGSPAVGPRVGLVLATHAFYSTEILQGVAGGRTPSTRPPMGDFGNLP